MAFNLSGINYYNNDGTTQIGNHVLNSSIDTLATDGSYPIHMSKYMDYMRTLNGSSFYYIVGFSYTANGTTIDLAPDAVITQATFDAHKDAQNQMSLYAIYDYQSNYKELVIKSADAYRSLTGTTATVPVGLLADKIRAYNDDVINGIISEYRASGADISANTFVEFVTGTTVTAGTETVFNTATTSYISASLLDSTHVLVCYTDGGNSSYGTTQVLTISGTTVTAGTETVFNSGNTYYISASLLDSTHALVCYRDDGNSSYGTTQVLTISGTTVTAGTKTVFNSGNTYYISAVSLDSTHALVCYRDDGNSSYGTTQVLTISGTTVTAGTETVFNTAITSYISASLLDSTHALVCYEDGGNSNYGTTKVLTISGTTVTAGTKTVFNTAITSYISASLLDSTHALVCYRDGGNSNYGTTQVLTISGTTVTAGTKTVFNSGRTYYISAVSLDSTHALVCYQDGGNSNYGTTQVLTISGTTVTAGTETVFNSGNTYDIPAVSLDSTHALVCYQDGDNSNYGTTKVLTNALATPSVTKIEGLTKTKCTSTTAGKVYTL